MSDPSELPPIADSPLSVLLLAGADDTTASEVAAEWEAELQKLGRVYEILVVSPIGPDGKLLPHEPVANGDRTFAIPEPIPATDKLSESERCVRYLKYPGPPGLGAALRIGLAAARHPLLFYTTCDHQYQAADLKRFLDMIDQVHLVSGFRLFARVPLWLRWLGVCYRCFVRLIIGESLEPLPGWLGWRGQIRRLLARLFFGVRLRDVECAFRLFRRAIFDRIPIQSDGAFAQVEILAKANFLGCFMTEEPIAHHPLPALEPDLTRARWRQAWQEARQVLSHPDFGPACLPELPAPPGERGASAP
jgi:hypothetical protein